MAGRFRKQLIYLLSRAVEHAGEPETDYELVRRFVDTRDPSAFELLVRRHGAMVFGVCLRTTRDVHKAEDAFQATFLVFAQKAGSIRNNNVAGWLYRIARRAANRIRRKSSSREIELTVDVPAASSPAAVEIQELSVVLDEEVARLPERIRLPVLLCYLGDHSTEEASRLLGCPSGTIKSRLATARTRLAARLTRRGITLPAVGIGVNLLDPAAIATAARVTPAAVRLALLFTAGRAAEAGSAATASTLLAQQVVRSMATAKIVGIAGVIVLLAGVGTGTSVWLGTNPTGPLAAQIVAADPPAKQSPPAPTSTPKTVEATKQRRLVLEHAAKIIDRQIADKQKQVESLGDSRAKNNQPGVPTVDVKALEIELAKVDATVLGLEKQIETDKDQIAKSKDLLDHPEKIQPSERRQPTSKGTRSRGFGPSNIGNPELLSVSDPLYAFLTKSHDYEDAYADYRQAVNHHDSKSRNRRSPASGGTELWEKEMKDLKEKMEAAETRLKALRAKLLPQAEKDYREARLVSLSQSIDTATKRMETAESNLADLAKQRLKWVHRIWQTKQSKTEVQAAEEELQILNDIQRMIRRQQILLDAGLEGAIQPKSDADPRLEDVLRELAEMRKEIGELKKK